MLLNEGVFPLQTPDAHILPRQGFFCVDLLHHVGAFDIFAHVMLLHGLCEGDNAVQQKVMLLDQLQGKLPGRAFERVACIVRWELFLVGQRVAHDDVLFN